MNTKQHIINVISDTVSNFVHYDRQGDEDLPVGALEQALRDKGITVNEITEEFRKCLELQLHIPSSEGDCEP